MKILVIEDDVQVATYIQKGLKEHGHAADHADNGKDGLFLATTETYDALVVDRMLPGLDGLALIKTMRGAGNTTPALIRRELGEVDDRVMGLRAGGDDYLTKPFAFTELMARLEVMGRRNTPQTVETVRLTAGKIDMDLLARKVTCNGKPVNIQSREFRLLEYLLRNKGRVVTRTMLLEHVWDYHFDPQTNVIDVHISRLRSKIDGDGEHSIIKTVRGAGYIIED